MTEPIEPELGSMQPRTPADYQTDNQPVLAQDNGQLEENRPVSVYTIAGIAAFAALVVTLSSLAGYHALFGRQQQIGLVDIADILTTSETVFTERLARSNVTDDDRKQAMEQIQQTGPRLDAAIGELQKDCGCLLMTKAAVIGAGIAIDYTPQVKATLGLDKVDTKELQQHIRDALKIKLPDLNPDKTKGEGG